MRFHADLHIHSKYSRATSRDLDLEHLSFWAGRKGVALVGTGDFTHPAWRAELKEKLVPAEPGLFRLRSEIERAVADTLPPACQATTRFMLTVEISTIYKKGDRTRKIHHLIYAPDFETADRFSAALARIGNIASDGRPILGLDSRHLLEIALDSGPGAYLIPAHIWTPWFAALGSQSGFDSIVECYGDLSDHIFAVETGLSSDPPMNWRLSQLDRYRLVSNSDAHSPGKIGREATTFDTDLDYYAIRRALETGDGYVGTVEFFPEEGKYHLDGHRKCGTRLTPEESLAHGNRCPVCGQPATIGVLNRVNVLADRSEAEAAPPPTAGDVVNLVPLPEVLSELVSSGPSSQTVGRNYDRLLATLGSELAILRDVPVEDIARSSSPLLAEAVTRLRAGRVIREAGYDGEYGTIHLFEEAELRQLTNGGSLFGDAPATRRVKRRAPETTPTVDAQPVKPARSAAATSDTTGSATAGLLSSLDEDQRRAAEIVDGPLAIVAGPGSGKTRTLAHRFAYLVAERGVPASSCLAITFTRRAAREMRERLADLLPDRANVAVHTFHSLGLSILREHGEIVNVARELRIATEAERAAMLAEALSVSSTRAESLLRAISKARRTDDTPDGKTAEALNVYQQELARRQWVDFDDLVGLAVQILSTDAAVAARYRARFQRIAVDEFQDVDDRQYRLLTLLAPANAHLCVIGDPHQAIYGFRGADASCFDRFAIDYPSAPVIRLTRNYRSTGTIVTASSQVIAGSTQAAPISSLVREMHERITIHAAPTDRAETEFVVAEIERLLGGHSLFSIDSGRATGATQSALGFADFAVLARTSAQMDALREAFARSGLPFHAHTHDPFAAQPAVQAILREWERGVNDALREPAGMKPAGDDSRNVLVAQLDAAAARLPRDAVDVAAKELALQRLRSLAESCDGDRARFLDLVALAADADFRDPRAASISLMTLHAAKGLEFAVVFIVGLEDGLLPLRWSEFDEAAADEERRLLYVGMTRAKDRLILSRATERPWRGQRRQMPASPFLLDIEQQLVEHQRTDARPKVSSERQMKLL
ncbi:MAG TPA: UvrD-helicase domain-containing protein [Vicinamibacterales bacterium]|nr:UvrD-helicase domain-containing protein [Vicinamibacterales bacterium]